MIFDFDLPGPDPLRAAVTGAARADETERVRALAEEAALDDRARARVAGLARRLVEAVREHRPGSGGLDAFLQQYALASPEGVVLMCLAEALLRIPDAATADRLIAEKLGSGDWETHVGKSESLFVNASTWALMLTGRMVRLGEARGDLLRDTLTRLVAKSGEPVVRQAVTAAMRILGGQFVLGRTIEEALARAREGERSGLRHSYDMLGEAARTAPDAERYRRAYAGAIEAVGAAAGDAGPVHGPEVSVKLSALHPRFEFAQRGRVRRELTPVLAGLAAAARDRGLGLIVDAEEADRLDVTLDAVAALAADPDLAGWDGLGLAVQAYQKRAVPVIEWLADLARRTRRRLKVRLVKGAYWDTEIKRAQEHGLDDYPVYTRKVNTDVSYLACARRLLAAPDRFYPQFATHNAHTLAAVHEMAGADRECELQRLHGMGEALYETVAGPAGLGRPCRVYAPVGSHEDLLAYLVRRLLENGANTSFVNRIVDAEAPVEALIADPVARARGLADARHPHIPRPADLFLPERRNSRGRDLADPATLADLARTMEAGSEREWAAAPLVGESAPDAAGKKVYAPADRRRPVGRVLAAAPEDVNRALAAATGAATAWSAAGAGTRADRIEHAADAIEADGPTLAALLVEEGGKTIPDALDEVREAVDFCRYYASLARRHLAEPEILPGVTGEDNALTLHGRGVFACISPWNFPLAIFCGQVAAALVAGNAVVAKPAEQTPLVAAAAVRLMRRAGIPPDVLHLLPGDGTVGAHIVGDPRVDGVAFTGSTETARTINRSLAAREGPIAPLVAETGGVNAMIVDSSALAEQVVRDAVASAFRSAGQRCSALRVLYVQADTFAHVEEMLAGAMAELRVGDPRHLATDVGPIIDDEALAALVAHRERMDREARLVGESPRDDGTEHGSYFAPRAYEIADLGHLPGEVFGPILHLIRYDADALDEVLDAIDATGYGLTLGIHSRVDRTVERIRRRLRIGNVYVNRDQIGAVVGSQPFGGERLSGTGPKAGGPHYLFRFTTERVVTVDTTARGGNTWLFSLPEEDAQGQG